MKITPEHYAYILRAMRLATCDRNLLELEGRYRTQGLSPKRFRWDWSYAARAETGEKLSVWICDNIYPYANDTHLDTALRQVMRELGCTWAAQA